MVFLPELSPQYTVNRVYFLRVIEYSAGVARRQ
jgi:hypothetical protein